MQCIKFHRCVHKSNIILSSSSMVGWNSFPSCWVFNFLFGLNSNHLFVANPKATKLTKKPKPSILPLILLPRKIARAKTVSAPMDAATLLYYGLVLTAWLSVNTHAQKKYISCCSVPFTKYIFCAKSISMWKVDVLTLRNSDNHYYNDSSNY